MIRIPFPPYDKVRFGVPWCGIVMEWGAVLPKDGMLRPPHNLILTGEWKGTAKKGGNIILTGRYWHPAVGEKECPVCMVNRGVPGQVLRWGQRNRATGRTTNEGYGITLTLSTFKHVDKRMAWQWYVRQWYVP